LKQIMELLGQNAPMGLLEKLQKHIDALKTHKIPAVDVEEPVVETSLETHVKIPTGDELLEKVAKELLDQKLTEGEAITEVDEAELDLKQIMEKVAKELLDQKLTEGEAITEVDEAELDL
jgi:hypothetical protein